MENKTKKSLIPRVLITTPVSKRHSHLLDEWLENLNNLTYPGFDVCLVDTTPNTESYFKLLKTKKVHNKPITVFRHKWDYKKWHAVQMMAHAREEIRKYFLKEGYDYIFWLDDDIFIPKWSIQRLISYNKDQVGFYVHVYFKPTRKPCVLKSGEIFLGKGLDYFTFSEINAYKSYVKKMKKGLLSKEEKLLEPFIIKDKRFPQLMKPYACNIGCLLVKKKVVEAVHFRTHPSFIFGEDLWYFNEAVDKRFEFWCDSNVRAIHKNTEWGSLVKKGPKQGMNFYLAFGPEKTDKLVLHEGGKK